MSGLRVVSLVPSTTETLLAWGVDVVGCTRFCEQPDLRAVGGTKDLTISAVIDVIDQALGPHFFPPKADGTDPRHCPACKAGRLVCKCCPVVVPPAQARRCGCAA